MAMNLLQGAAHWKRVRKGMEAWVGAELEFVRQQALSAHLDEMRDAPNESEYRDPDDDGPIRIVSAGLWMSLKGPGDLQFIHPHKLPSNVRIYKPHFDPYQSHIRKLNIAGTASQVIGKMTYGTNLHYALKHERAHSKPFQFFRPGIETLRSQWPIVKKTLAASLRFYIKNKFRHGSSS